MLKQEKARIEAAIGALEGLSRPAATNNTNHDARRKARWSVSKHARYLAGRHNYTPGVIASKLGIPTGEVRQMLRG